MRRKIDKLFRSYVTGGSLSFSSGTLTLAMPTNYTASMSSSNLTTPTNFIYKGTELSTTVETYFPLADGTVCNR